MKDENAYCGIDVSKRRSDAFFGGRTVRCETAVKGVKALAVRAGNAHCVFESTGGLERMAAWMLPAAGRVAGVVNPGRVRDDAESMGQLAKTDRIDARIIAEHARIAKPNPSELPSKEQRMPCMIVDRREQLARCVRPNPTV